MNSGDALWEIRRLATQGRFRVDAHARKRGRERGATHQDIREALMNATKCEANKEDASRWDATGPDLDEDPLTCVVTFDGDLVVVTLFEKG